MERLRTRGPSSAGRLTAPTRRRLRLDVFKLAAVLLFVAAATASGDEPDPVSAATYAGPPLWRVSKDGHVLWLFGTLSAVPKDMKWNATAVEEAVADAQAVLSPPGVRATPSMKPVQLVRLWRRVRELSGNPSGKRLVEVIPPDLYRRYAALRDRYVRRDRHLEEQRPIIVASRLYEDAVQEMGLASGREVESGIERVARRAAVATVDTKVLADPLVLLDHAARVPAPAELDCFTKVLATIETGDEAIAARARAWASGDVAALRRFDYPDIRRECLSFPGWPVALADALKDADDKWLESAEHALAANRTTFGTLDVRDLLTRDGLLAQLHDRGYDVQAP
jgi:uncharacterized protein YbaP (TraB family)